MSKRAMSFPSHMAALVCIFNLSQTSAYTLQDKDIRHKASASHVYSPASVMITQCKYRWLGPVELVGYVYTPTDGYPSQY